MSDLVRFGILGLGVRDQPVCCDMNHIVACRVFRCMGRQVFCKTRAQLERHKGYQGRAEQHCHNDAFFREECLH